MPNKKSGMGGAGADAFFPSSRPESLDLVEDNQQEEKRERKTFTMFPSVSLLLDRIQFTLRERGEKPSKSDLVERAIKLLAEKEGIES